MDPDSRMIPGIATSWKTIDDKTWEFKLRKGVKFHDGSELTAEDVVFSIDRVPQIPNSPGPFTAYTKAIQQVEIVDPYTIRFKYAAPYPLMPNDLSTIYIVSKKVATGATTEDFNSGKAAIGSGRYKFVRYVERRPRRARAQRRLLGRQAAATTRCSSRSSRTRRRAWRRCCPATSTRSSSRRPPTSRGSRTIPKFTLTSKISHRVIYFNFDHLERSSPFITGKDGKPLAKNPLLDVARAPRDLARRSTGRRSPSA